MEEKPKIVRRAKPKEMPASCCCSPDNCYYQLEKTEEKSVQPQEPKKQAEKEQV